LKLASARAVVNSLFDEIWVGVQKTCSRSWGIEQPQEGVAGGNAGGQRGRMPFPAGRSKTHFFAKIPWNPADRKNREDLS